MDTASKAALVTTTEERVDTPEAIPLVLPSLVRMLESEKDEKLARTLSRLGYTCSKKSLLVDGSVQDVLQYHKEDAQTSPNEHTFVVNDEAKLFFESLSEPFGVLAITGPLRSGKSTLVSLIVRFLHEYSLQEQKVEGKPEPSLFFWPAQRPAAVPADVFKVSNAKKCCTVGIWFWPKLFSLPNGKKFILLDVEGLYGIDPLNGKDGNYFLKLFVLTSFLSTVLVFNKPLMLSVGSQDFDEISKLAASIEAFCSKYPDLANIFLFSR